MWFWRLWHILFHESPRGHRCRGVPEVRVHKSGKQDAIYVDDLYDENVVLRAEIERLTAQLEITQEYARTIYASAEKYQGQRDELRADNERLRATLEKIEAGYGQRLSAAELASIARQAL
jgi:uncharacterized small protein (DUF1192 family)